MLTQREKENISNFGDLKKNHQRVFKHRLKKKCLSAIKDTKIVIMNYEKLGIKIDLFVDINELIGLYEDISLLQNL